MYRQIDQVFKMLKMFKILGTDLLSIWLSSLLLGEVSPLGSTALVTAVENPSNVRLGTSRLGPKMTGPTRTEDCRGMILHASHNYLRHREFPRRREAPRTPRAQ